MSSVIGFPNPVNEKAARSVAAGVLLIAVVAVAGQWLWLTALLAAGFALRVLSGPTLSPLGQLATRVIAPRLGHPKLVPGPPKRFAQTIGLVVTGGAALAWFAFGSALIASLFLALIIVAAALESIGGLCLGCVAFGYLMRAGVIPADTCQACNDISLRYRQTA
ncbi:DUF4395 domain-containing protein [Jatrophihabitans telluris]|uniref:DUF4395 domain-containing protein n=1 Tax=Jatrophihabitans telluris TaxID=2038343 RepID=A0ABY4R334_9ACTN|nr:DUF4395 domain-containing protein [Jatrophihabitans telluris]UQX90224.1 DUF4395 domain-containing protein [Jatrophihabitans telluris]